MSTRCTCPDACDCDGSFCDNAACHGERDTEQEALHTAESILALLHYRGIVDSTLNREDVAAALTAVRNALGRPGTYTARPIPDPPPTWRERFRGKR